jgi:hypothetical protein
MPEKPRIDCLKCQHYYITWDAKFPKGCRLYKFKSKWPPSYAVYDATGSLCEHFAEKTK